MGDGVLAHVVHKGCRVSLPGDLQRCLDMVLGTPLWVPMLAQGLDQVASRGAF